MRVKGMKDSYQMILCKINGIPMGKIEYKEIDSITFGINKIGEMSFKVNRYYGVDNKEFTLYNELKPERLINLDTDYTFIIKSVTEKNENEKTIKCYSREKKLTRNKVDGIEDISVTLMNPYEDIPSCYSLNDLLYKQTGWRLGYISSSVQFNSTQTDLELVNGVEGTLTDVEKLRYQESVNTNWYDYITKNISEQFECHPVFNSYTKTIDLLSEDELGENSNLLLSYDNYLKSKEKTSDTSDIVTRLYLEGNDDLTIVESNPSGERYIEDYSYFIDNREMTDELINALNTYNEIVKVRAEQWYNLKEIKKEKDKEYQDLQTQLLICYSKIRALQYSIDSSSDEAYIASKTEELVEQMDSQAILERDIKILNDEIVDLVVAIDNINKLCKKEYATDDNGILIFNEFLLNELKEFIYQDDYTDNNITDSLTLLQIGKKKIKELCIPTESWEIDSINFINRLIDNSFRQHWKGELGLGDKIILKKDDDYYEQIYLVGYTFNPKNGSLKLELSNKKTNKDFSLTIGEKLTSGSEAFKILKKKTSFINQIQNNRLGLDYDKINREF